MRAGSDTATVSECEQECIRLKCKCMGYKADDTGYFHKCRIISNDLWNGKVGKSATGFTAYTTSGEFPLLTDPDAAWEGWVVVGLALAYLAGGSAHGFVVDGRRDRKMLPHAQQWGQLIGASFDQFWLVLD